MSDPLLFRSAVELAGLIRARQITSEALVQALLAQIARHDGRTHAIVTLLADEALAAARAADAAVRAGGPLGALHGVPMTIKDAFCVAGVRTTVGLPPYRRYRPGRDYELVARIRRAGAIVLGRTNVPFASFDWQCRNPLFPETVNPWDEARTPGGSSGGAAAALSAGYTPLELGSDIAGSIRYPAHCCGVLGLRTSDGLLPKHDWAPEDMPASPWTLSTPGPMARSIGDLQLLLSVLEQAPVATSAATRLKIAMSPSLMGMAANAATARLLERLAGRLRDDGHEVVTAMPFADDGDGDGEDAAAAYRVWGLIAGYELRRLLPRPLRAWPGWRLYAAYLLNLKLGSGPLTRWTKRGMAATAREYDEAMAARARLQARADAFFGAHDLWMLPVSPGEAIRRQRTGRDLVVDGKAVAYSAYLGSYCCPTAVLGTPALTLPIGVGDTGLPIGIQVHGARMQDAGLLAAAERHLSRFVDVRVPAGYRD